MINLHKVNKKWKKNIYVPINISKYKGSKPIMTRSSWEYRFCRFLDFNTNVVEWISEQPEIPYLNPNTNTVWKYHPDFVIRVQTQLGLKTQMIEIKPKKQTVPPVVTEGKHRKTILYEMATWKQNCAKWEAAKLYCQHHGWEFKILTEENLFGYK